MIKSIFFYISTILMLSSIIYGDQNPNANLFLYPELDWKESFIQNALRVQLTCGQIPNRLLDIDLDPPQRKKLTQELETIMPMAALSRGIRFAEYIKKVYSGGQSFVFELNDFPGIILKTSTSVSKSAQKMESRYNIGLQAAKLIKQECLDRLLLPETTYLEIKKENEKYGIIAEKIADINPDFSFQEELYSYCFNKFISTPGLFAYFKELFTQLTLFICKTGFWDVKFNNIPLDNKGRGIVLVDIEDIFAPDLRVKAKEGIVALLRQIAPPSLFDVILDTATQCLGMSSQEILGTLSLEKIAAERLARIQEIEQLYIWYEQKSIVKGDEPVIISEHEVGISSPLKIKFLEGIVAAINDEIRKHAGSKKSIAAKRRIILEPANAFGHLINENRALLLEEYPNLKKEDRLKQFYAGVDIITDLMRNNLPLSSSIFKVYPPAPGSPHNGADIIQA